MENCGTCKYWKKKEKCGECLYLYLEYPDLPGDDVMLCRSAYEEPKSGVSHFVVGPCFGCVHWKEMPEPFYVRPAEYCTLRGTKMSLFKKIDWWDVLYREDGMSIHATTDEGKAVDLCRTLNELWRKDKE